MGIQEKTSPGVVAMFKAQDAALLQEVETLTKTMIVLPWNVDEREETASHGESIKRKKHQHE
jgi:hypothetical protein